MSTTLSCAQCNAPIRADQGWCSLCYAKVESDFDPLTAPLDDVIGHDEASAAEESVPASDPPLQLSEPVSDGTVEELDDSVSDVDVMLSMLAAEHRQTDATARFMGRMEDRATRITVMVGGSVIVAALCFAALTLLGAIF